MSASAARKGSASGSKSAAPKKKAAVAPPIDELEGLDTAALGEVLRASQSRLLEVRRHRNFYQLEKDQVQGFYSIVQDEVSKTESHLRNIESQMERMQDTHRNDIRIYLQKVVHLEYEHENNLAAVQQQAQEEKQAEADHHAGNKRDLQDTKMRLKQQLEKGSQSHEEEIRRLKEVERKEMTKLREQFERNYSELVASYESRLQSLRADLHLRAKMEVHEIEERKNRHINDLMIHHQKNFEEMRLYYNSITQDNLDLIKELNHEIEDLKQAHTANERAMEAIEKKNASLAEPLAQAEARVRALKHKLANYAKDKTSLAHARNRLVVLEEQYKTLGEAHAKLREEYAACERERTRLYDTFSETVSQVQRSSSGRNDALEAMLEDYAELFDVKRAQFTSVLRASNLDPLVLANVTKKLDDVLTSKNEQIEELRYEQAKVTKAHNDLCRVYEAKLRRMGVPEEQLNMEPLITQAQYHGAGTGTAPADLLVQ